MQPIKTLIFDMDGVIFDTESLVRKCWNTHAKTYGLCDIDTVFLSCLGTTRTRTHEIFIEHYGTNFPYETFRADASKTFHAFIEANGVPIKPGVRELLTWAKEHDFHIGLASSTRQIIVEQELKQANLYCYFDHVLGGDQLTRSKPFPDIYLMACHKLNVEPYCAYAIEDSYNGIRSASAAGMHPVMVPDLLPPTQEMQTLCDAIYPNLSDFQTFLSKQI